MPQVNAIEASRPLLLDVWREACRHVEIGDALAECAATVFAVLPIDVVVVRRIDVGRQSLDTVAIGSCRPGAPLEHARSQLVEKEFQSFLAWCRQGKVCHRTPGGDEPLIAGIAPQELQGEILAGPLNGPEGPIGVVLWVNRGARPFAAQDEQTFELLLEPFTVWLENDRRLRELRALGEAAEADKRSLLSRLGRNELTEKIIGAETGLRTIMERVNLVARTVAPVLILGETGAGKEVVARAIHEQSPRVNGPFLRVNCGAIPSELVDSELFGHERGSFTGAVGDRRGWFERADGGTLFLDECGELPPAAQVRLLRILQDGTFERVGGERQVTVDVRIVAATHRDLQAMAAAGRFREDLWYRLAVFPLHLPPLRDRPEDVPALSTHFALRAAQRSGLPVVLPTPDDLNRLIAYSWPGNVRELAAVIERAVILGDGKQLAIGTALGGIPSRAATPAKPSAEDSFATLDEAMAQHIRAALQRTRGRIEGPQGAARLLGINPHTLRARMRKLGLDWQRFRTA